MKKTSLLLSFLSPLLLGVVVIMSLYTTYNYFQAKNRLINEINSDVESIILQLKDTLPYFINSYAIDEYEKLIDNQVKHKNILAVIVKDYNYGKIFSKEFIESGKINLNDKIENYDEKNPKYQELIKTFFH